MRDSALKLLDEPAILAAAELVGNELMRDSALKPACPAEKSASSAMLVGNELMRDSALKPVDGLSD